MPVVHQDVHEHVVSQPTSSHHFAHPDERMKETTFYHLPVEHVDPPTTSVVHPHQHYVHSTETYQDFQHPSVPVYYVEHS